jgi:hypothetical protein
MKVDNDERTRKEAATLNADTCLGRIQKLIEVLRNGLFLLLEPTFWVSGENSAIFDTNDQE